MPNFSTIRTTVITVYLDNDGGGGGGGDDDNYDDDNNYYYYFLLINVAIPSDRAVIQNKA
jgi:hypothetical protein